MDEYRQCEIHFSSGAVEVCWLPLKLAKEGATITLSDYGSERIVVCKVYRAKQTFAEIQTNRKADFPSIGL